MNRFGLSKADTEKAAGPRPPERPGFILYAKWNTNRYGDHAIWVYARPRGYWRAFLLAQLREQDASKNSS